MPKAKLDKAVALAAKVLDDHKATDIEVIDVKERTPFADYYVIATASNVRQLNALAEIIEEEFEKNKFDVGHIEGKADSGWILIDAHHVIVNLFTKEERERISLEDLVKASHK